MHATLAVYQSNMLHIRHKIGCGKTYEKSQLVRKCTIHFGDFRGSRLFNTKFLANQT